MTGRNPLLVMRDQQIAELATQGMTCNEIADKLNLNRTPASRIVRMNESV